MNKGDEFERKGGGPAFPRIITEDWREIEVGMTLRDYFAAKIAASLVTGCAGLLSDGKPSAYAQGPCNSVVAERAYVLADALLRQRLI